MDSGPIPLGWLARATFVVAAVLSLFWLSWLLTHVLFLLVGALVVAVILLALRDLLTRFLRLTRKWALGGAVLLLAVVFAVFFFLMGSQMAGQFTALQEKLPAAIDSIRNRFGVDVLAQLRTAQINWMPHIAGYFPDLIGALGSIVFILVSGVFLAVNPRMYKKGLLTLLPVPRREPVGKALDSAGYALRLWLVGKIITMVVIGVVTTAGLYLIGIPSPLALGFLAGLLEFIPFLGPILAFVPAGAVALSAGQGSFVWVLGLYVVIQQLENNLLVPLVQQHTVELPPVLGMFAVVSFGLLFGPIGVILGVPLAIIILVLVKELYVSQALGEDVSIPGRE